MKEHGDKISAEEKKAIEDAKAEVEGALKLDDAEKIKTAVANLTNASMKLGEAVYKQVHNKNNTMHKTRKQKNNSKMIRL